MCDGWRRGGVCDGGGEEEFVTEGGGEEECVMKGGGEKEGLWAFLWEFYFTYLLFHIN